MPKPNQWSKKKKKSKRKESTKGCLEDDIDEEQLDPQEEGQLDPHALEDWSGGLARVFGVKTSGKTTLARVLWLLGHGVDIAPDGCSQLFLVWGPTETLVIESVILPGKLHTGLRDSDGHAVMIFRWETAASVKGHKTSGALVAKLKHVKAGLPCISDGETSDAVVKSLEREIHAIDSHVDPQGLYVGFLRSAGPQGGITTASRRPKNDDDDDDSMAEIDLVAMTDPYEPPDLGAYALGLRDNIERGTRFVNDAAAGARFVLKLAADRIVNGSLTNFGIRDPDSTTFDVLIVALLPSTTMRRDFQPWVVIHEAEPLFVCVSTRVTSSSSRGMVVTDATMKDIMDDVGIPPTGSYQELLFPSAVIDKIDADLLANEVLLASPPKTRVRQGRVSLLGPLDHVARVNAKRQHSERECNVCGQRPAKKTCSRCKVAAYCSEACQRRDWRTHKATCRAPEDEEDDNATSSSWVDVDPTMDGLAEMASRLGLRQDTAPPPVSYAYNMERPQGARDWTNQPKVSKDRIFYIKAQAPLNPGGGPQPTISTSSAPITIYDQPRKLMCHAGPSAFASRSAYELLFTFIRQQGCAGDKFGLPFGLKVYARAYMTPEKKLRIFTDRPVPPQPW